VAAAAAAAAAAAGGGVDLMEIARRAGAIGDPAAIAGAAAAAASAPSSSMLLYNSQLQQALAAADESASEPPTFRQQSLYLLEEWVNLCLTNAPTEKSYTQFLMAVQQLGIVQSEELCRRFFTLLIEACVDQTLKAMAAAAAAGGVEASVDFSTIDALVKMVAFVQKYVDVGVQPLQSEVGSRSARLPMRLSLLSSFLNAAVRVLLRDFGARLERFNQRPYLRLLSMLLVELHQPDPLFDSNNPYVLLALASAMHAIRPSVVPAFCFAWLELVSHRMFMPKILISRSQQLSQPFCQLLVDLLEFQEPFLRNADMPETIRTLYRGTMRVLLVLLHDFPEFLADYHFALCDAIPTTCVQMRNLVLFASPSSMRLPDPFSAGLKVDLLPEITQPPRILSDFSAALARHPALPRALEEYLLLRSPRTFLQDMCEALLLPASEAVRAGNQYNVPLINSLVLYVGTRGIQKMTMEMAQNNSAIMFPFQDNAFMDVFEALVTLLDGEGRFLALNAMANQLRYPNTHTHYFSCVLLHLFLQAKTPALKEQITRVLLERLIVHRPHPWGLLVAFIELIKNQRYEFWQQPFIHMAPEIERLFENVSRMCMQPGSNGGLAPPGPAAAAAASAASVIGAAPSSSAGLGPQGGQGSAAPGGILGSVLSGGGAPGGGAGASADGT
jgi:CCR4-NOT transcription complex subunit 1